MFCFYFFHVLCVYLICSETFTCDGGTNRTSIQEETINPSFFDAQLFGNQFQRKIECDSASGYAYKAEKTVSISNS